MVVGNLDASNPVMGVMPDLPATRLFQNSSPLPIADTTPTPVMTMRSPGAAAPPPNAMLAAPARLGCTCTRGAGTNNASLPQMKAAPSSFAESDLMLDSGGPMIHK